MNKSSQSYKSFRENAFYCADVTQLVSEDVFNKVFLQEIEYVENPGNVLQNKLKEQRFMCVDVTFSTKSNWSVTTVYSFIFFSLFFKPGTLH